MMKRVSYKEEVERLKGVIEEYRRVTARTVVCCEIFDNPDGGLGLVITAPNFNNEDKFIQAVGIQLAAAFRYLGVEKVTGIDTEIAPEGVREPDEPATPPSQKEKP